MYSDTHITGTIIAPHLTFSPHLISTMFACAAIVAALLFTLLYIFHLTQCCSKHPLMTNYPILGMLPPLLWNLFRIHDFLTDSLKRRGGTGEFMGPWFAKMNYTFTSDPINVHHMLSKSFNNYVKGPEFREIFQPFGEGIFTADSDTWKYNRLVVDQYIILLLLLFVRNN